MGAESEAASAAVGMTPIGAGAAAAQGAFGLVQSISSALKTPALMNQLRAFKTPAEYSKILQAAQAGASSGYDAFTLNYLTSGINKAAAASLGTAARLGADPNDLSGILEQRIAGLMKVGAENHQLNMNNFSRYLSAMDMMAKNKEAEFISNQNLIKDKLQAVQANKTAGMANIGSSLNAFVSMDAASRYGSLYGGKAKTPVVNMTDYSSSNGISLDDATTRAMNKSTLINR